MPKGRLLARLLRGWREIGAGIGTLVALVAICGALGAAIALPLWLFATSERRIYTIVVAAAAAAGIVYLVVRRLARPPAGGGAEGGRTARRALGSLASALVAVLRVVLLVATVGATVSLAGGGRWLAALPAAAAALAVAAWIGISAGSRNRR